MKQRSVFRMFPVLLVALLALGAGAAINQETPQVLHAAGMPPATGLMGDPYLIADVAERVTPAVVYVEVTYPAPQRGSRSPFDDPFFRDFFWPFSPWQEQGPRPSRGTGFIVDKEGYILTNQHVVGDPGANQTIKVRLHTPEFEGEVEAELLGSDYQLDLAVLKVKKPDGITELPTVPLGDSEASRPGEWVIAIGNPYGQQFEHTVTVGVLSAKGREIQIYDNERRRSKTYSNLMQTDAAINPGNSGGPLVNIQGEAIGINTAVNAQAQGIGFAIPINTALEVMDQLISEGRVVRRPSAGPFLGVQHQAVDERIQQALGLPEAKGALIVGVIEGTAAEAAGLRVYDVLLQFDETEINTTDDLVEAISKTSPGDSALLVVWRQGARTVVPVTIGDRADVIE